MRVWLLPAVTAFGFLAVLNFNREVFFLLNKLGPLTGDWLWANITVFGDTLVALALCTLLWRRRPDLVWAALLAALLATLWARGLKALFDVPRPPAVLGDLSIIGPAYKYGSFPSGHATTAFTLAGVVALGFASRAAAICAVAAAALVGVSRAAVGVHWPLDILAGAFGGWVAAVLGIYFSKKTSNIGLHPGAQWTLGLVFAACAALLVIGHPKNDYPQSDLLLRALGLACLVAAGARLNRDFRRRPGL
jgi:membrane-associated phospholipid phosphatase